MDSNTFIGGRAEPDCVKLKVSTIVDVAKPRFVFKISESLQCCLCKQALEEPVQTPCGQRVCCKCLKDLLEYAACRHSHAVQ
eukprot:m.192487 g.192487  ORF g.192487 m.192487 type:complete len:82 (+) comp39474_c0_seq4:239-484(+)